MKTLKILPGVLVMAMMLLAGGCASVGPRQSFNNPTEYTFTASKDQVVAALHQIRSPKSWGPMGGAYSEKRNSYVFLVDDYYTPRYWSGKIEQDADVDPVSAGRIGTIQANFSARTFAVDATHTKVVVTVDEFKQQVGRRYHMAPDFRKGPVFEDVKSDTYFEYLFLTELGAILGEKNMPALKGKL